MTREATILRETAETRIEVTVNLDGAGRADVACGIGFFDHMLCAFARHGRFDLKVSVRGDLHVDGHHTVEDTGIVLGRALAEALGEKAGIERFGSAFVPMDEALVLAACDVSGRGQLISTLSSPGSSSSRLPLTRASPCTSGSSLATTCTTSSRPPSRRQAAPCARPWPSTRPWVARFPQLKACYEHRHCRLP